MGSWFPDKAASAALLQTAGLSPDIAPCLPSWFEILFVGQKLSEEETGLHALCLLVLSHNWGFWTCPPPETPPPLWIMDGARGRHKAIAQGWDKGLELIKTYGICSR